MSTVPLRPGDDKQMIETPDLWPVWPYLPMKNPQLMREGKPGMGFFFNGSLRDDTVTFYEGAIWEATAAVKTDLSVQQVLDAGWVVD